MECATSFNVTGVSSYFLVLVDFEVFAVLSDADSDLSADVHAKSEVTDSVRSKRSAVIRFFIRSSR